MCRRGSRLECDNAIGERDGSRHTSGPSCVCVCQWHQVGSLVHCQGVTACYWFAVNTQAEAQRTVQHQQQLQQEVSRLRSKVHQRGFEVLTQQQLLQVAQQQIKQAQQQVAALQQELAAKQQQMQQQEQQAAASKAEAANAR